MSVMRITLTALFFLNLIFSLLESKAQKISLPSQKEWVDYLYVKENAIKSKLQNHAYRSDITTYKNDSLKSILHSEDVTTRLSYPRHYFNDSFNLKNPIYEYPLKSFWFKKKIHSSPFDATQISTLSAIALTYSPINFEMKTTDQAWCWLDINEIKNILTQDEFEWLKLIYYYAENDNSALPINISSFDIYQDIHHRNDAFTIYTADSTLFKKISSSLEKCNFYIEDDINDFFGLLHPQFPFIYDFQKNTKLTLSQFQKNYTTDSTAVIYLDYYDPSLTKDTILKIPYKLNSVQSLNIDKQNGKIKSLNIAYRIVPSKKLPIIQQFSIDVEDLKAANQIPMIFWFFEDYFRWKSK